MTANSPLFHWTVIGVSLAAVALLLLYRPTRTWLQARSTLNRLLGILVLVFVLYEVLMLSNPRAGSVMNHQNLARRLGFYGVLTLGAGVLIISGGIDLSIGSVVGLAAVSMALLVEPRGRYNLGETLTGLLRR